MKDSQSYIVWIILVVLTLLFFLFLISSSEFYKRKVSQAKSIFGAKYLIIDYKINTIRIWELQKGSVVNETNSDGIYFIDEDGDEPHISMPYFFVRVKSFKIARKKYKYDIKNVVKSIKK